MSDRPAKPFYLDVLTRKHEAYPYDESGSSVVEVEHEGRSLRLLIPEHQLPASFRVSSIRGDFLFLIGEQLDFQDVDGRIIEGGDGVLIVALKMADRVDTYWTLVWHNLFSWTLEHLERATARDPRK